MARVGITTTEAIEKLLNFDHSMSREEIKELTAVLKKLEREEKILYAERNARMVAEARKLLYPNEEKALSSIPESHYHLKECLSLACPIDKRDEYIKREEEGYKPFSPKLEYDVISVEPSEDPHVGLQTGSPVSQLYELEDYSNVPPWQLKEEQ